MPNYEYYCLQCNRKFDIFMTYSEFDTKVVTCPHCKSESVQRKIGRIRVTRSEESRLDNLADPASLEGLEDDPRALGRMMRKMSAEVGEEMPGEFNEVVTRLESGQSPEQIEKELPDLGGAGDSIDGGFGGGLAGGLDDL